MITKNKSLLKKLPPAELYREDLQEIFNLINQVKMQDSKMQIETEDKIFDSTDELFDMDNKTIKELMIMVFNPVIKFSAKENNAYIYVGEDTILNNGLVEKIIQIFQKRRTKYFLGNPKTRNIIYWIFIMLIFSSYIFIHSYDQIFLYKYLNNYYMVTYFLFILLQSVSIVKDNIINNYRYCLLHLDNKIEIPSFWKRNKDKIFVDCLILLIGSVLTLLLQHIIKHFQK